MEVRMRTRSVRSLLSGGVLALTLAVSGVVATPASAAAYPIYFAGGGEGTTRAAAEADAASDAFADKAAYEAENGKTCTINTRNGGAYQLGPTWWGAYVLLSATCQ
jgi:hypothetical protein